MLLSGYDGESNGLKICPLKELPKKKQFTALSVGCGDKKPPTQLKETVLEAIRAKKTGDAKLCTYFPTEAKATPGRSGGPLIDSHGRVLGICSGVEKNAGYYCHLEDIRQFLSANALDWLLADEP